MELTSSRLRSLSQRVLHDPSLQALPGQMAEGDAPPIDLESVSELVAQSEIDFRTLKANVLEQFAAAQGLGSVIGLMTLGSRHGFKADYSEIVGWVGGDDECRSARIPKIFFLRERANELV
ncbi:DUF3375 family protein [Aeromonas salmonicida]|uniref:DUF3375 family protein n=1 Tax=Aeromonas salmonicida TaxID=645 RepID=UPI001F1D1C0C|nr:DUF3375 family protein [Aeromonas salmonicida]MCE9935088.1 DUF3375 family protein [Aeromonas salmonicida]